MNRFLLIDGDRETVQQLGLACLERGIAVTMADTMCEGVRVLLNESVSLIVVEATQLRLGVHEHATLFERVAPGVPVAVVIRSTTSLEMRVALELAGFRVLAAPASVDDLVKIASRATC